MKKLSTILLLMLLFVACNGTDEPVPTPTEAAIIEPPPTETAVAEPTVVLTEVEIDNTSVEEESESVETETDNTEEEPDLAETETAPVITFQLEAWADNWFAAYLGEELIVEDSVSITTERSFNAETAVFEANYPLTLNFILKDFKKTIRVWNISAASGSKWGMADSFCN